MPTPESFSFAHTHSKVNLVPVSDKEVSPYVHVPTHTEGMIVAFRSMMSTACDSTIYLSMTYSDHVTGCWSIYFVL
jgi:hypothetical protein